MDDNRAGPLGADEDGVTSQIKKVAQDYSNGEERPLGGYVGLLAIYGGVVTASTVAFNLSGRRLPERPSIGDLALFAVATHKVSRIIAKDPVTSPLRAPFTSFEGQSGPAELKEDVRGHGFRHALGELLTCPFCLGQWVATGFWFGRVVRPRETRLLASVFATVAIADALQLAYGKAE